MLKSPTRQREAAGRSVGGMPPVVRSGHAELTSMRRGCACACLGTRRVSTPSLRLASMRAASSSRLRVKMRRKRGTLTSAQSARVSCGASSSTRPSMDRLSPSSLTSRRSLETPGMSASRVMPPASSKMSTAGATGRSLEPADFVVAISLRSAIWVLLNVRSRLKFTAQPSLDGDALRLRGHVQRDADAKDAVPVPGFDLERVDVVREGNGTRETTFVTLVRVQLRLRVARRNDRTANAGDL